MSQDDPEPVSIRRQGKTVVAVIPADSLVQARHVELVCAQIDRAVDAAPDGASLLLSFIEVRYMSSVFLGKLMGFQKKLLQKNGRLMLSDLNSHLTDVIRLAKLDQYMSIYPTKRAALAGRTPVWMALMAASVCSEAVGGICLGRLIKYQQPIRTMGQLAVGYLMATILLPLVVYLGRDRLARSKVGLQWGATVIILLLMLLAALWIFLGY